MNLTGKHQGWHEVDLLQEHYKFWIKVCVECPHHRIDSIKLMPLCTYMFQDYYQAHGSGASWKWLETIAPCVEILCRLATDIHALLGSKQSNHHATPDLTDDIDELMGSLAHHNVYVE